MYMYPVGGALATPVTREGGEAFFAGRRGGQGVCTQLNASIPTAGADCDCSNSEAE